MKPAAFLWNIPDVPKDAKNKQYLYFKDPSCACDAIFKKDITPLYTAHEISEFVRRLYFDDNFIEAQDWDQTVFDEIADKIENDE